VKKEVCTTFDPYMKKICHNDLVMSWSCELSDGTVVYGDYDRPEYESCWERFKNHCSENKLIPTKISVYMFGAPKYIFFEDPSGLDGVSISRGVAREQSMSGDSRDFQFLTVSLLAEECDNIDVRKFVWPKNEFEESESKRLVTKKNIENMIFKHDSEKIKHPEIQKYFNRAAV
jgi:hypothetical protein